MTNDEIWEWMQRDLDGDLSAVEKQLLQNHVRKDPGLQLMYSRLKTVSHQLEQLPPVTPAFSIVDSILPKLESAAATPAARHSRHEDVLPTLEVKRQTTELPPESKKWKRVTVWLARIGSTAVAACLLIGMMFMGNDSNKENIDQYQQGSQLPSPPVVDNPVPLGPPAPTPSNNPSPPIQTADDKKPEKDVTQSKKQKQKQKSSAPPAKKQQTSPPQTSKPAVNKPVTPPIPVVKEEKPPVFPIGLEENSDKESRHEKDEVSDKGKDDKSDHKNDNKNDNKIEKRSKKENNENKQ